MGGFLSMLGLKAKFVVIILILAVVAGFVYWINWSAGMITENANQKTTIEGHVKTIDGLRKDISDYTATKEKLDTGFSLIADDQIDLICASRVSADVMIPAGKPTIVEVIKYRDRQTGCPTTDITKAEPYNPVTTVLRPTNEAISLQVINNSWKAYCLAINNEDDSCQPFR